MTTVVRARVDEEIKEKADEILKESGLTVSDAIRITLFRIVRDNDFILMPNTETAKTIREGWAGKDIHTAKDADDLFMQLGI